VTKSTNVEFITELMEFSKHGPMIQAYVLEALRLYSDSVVQNQDQIPECGFISRRLWVGCATEVLEKLEARNNG
jgi:hypothetical protein